MPHRSTALPTREFVVTKTLHLSFKWKDNLPALNSMNEFLELKTISQSGLNKIRNNSFPKYEKKQDGDNFVRCRECDRLKSLWASSTRRLHAEDLWDLKLKEHITTHWELCYAKRILSISEPNKVLTIIHDKMDQSKIASPHFSHKNKITESFIRLPVSITCMIIHRHRNI
jgi:hypothetical protein